MQMRDIYWYLSNPGRGAFSRERQFTFNQQAPFAELVRLIDSMSLAEQRGQKGTDG